MDLILEREKKFEAYRNQCKFLIRDRNNCTDTKNPTSHLEWNGCKDVTCPHRPFDIKPVLGFPIHG